MLAGSSFGSCGTSFPEKRMLEDRVPQTFRAVSVQIRSSLPPHRQQKNNAQVQKRFALVQPVVAKEFERF